MEKMALQLFIVFLLLLTLQLFDYSLNKQQLPSASQITGATISESQTTQCAEASPCKSPTGWKCQSNSRCYDFSDCLFQCPATPAMPVVEDEKKKELQPTAGCVCGDWETTGDCGQQGCDSSKIPQYRTCTSGQNCETNRCTESAHCITPQPKCVDLLCFDDEIGGNYCSYKCNLDGKRYEPSECEQKCVTPEKPTEKVFEGVNLVPEVLITPVENIKGGDTIEVVLNVKNTGTKSTHAKDVLGQCTGQSDNNCRMSFYNLIYFYKDKEYGTEVAPYASADVSLLFPEKEIKPRGQGRLEVIKRSVKIPDGFSGNLVIVAVADSQQKYIEAEGGEDDNRQTKTIAVRAAKLPDLIATEAEPIPTLEKVPVTLESVKIKVKNTGELDAVAENQFLENRVTIKKGNEVICSGYIRNLLTIKPGAFATDLPNIAVKAPGNNPCPIDDKDANYWAVVEVDAIEISGKKGFVAESAEDNTFIFQLKGPQACSPPGAREAGKYCSIATGTWLTQRADGQQCSHNFECNTDLCVCTTQAVPCLEKKCVSAEKKKQVIETVWK